MRASFLPGDSRCDAVWSTVSLDVWIRKSRAQVRRGDAQVTYANNHNQVLFALKIPLHVAPFSQAARRIQKTNVRDGAVLLNIPCRLTAAV